MRLRTRSKSPSAVARIQVAMTSRIFCFSSSSFMECVRKRLTLELSHAGPMTQDNPRLAGKPEVVLGVHPPQGYGGRVGPCDLQHRISHRSKISHQFLRCARKTGDLARNCTREPREIHETKSASITAASRITLLPYISKHHHPQSGGQRDRQYAAEQS